VKTMLRLWSCQAMAALGVVTLLKASSSQPSSTRSGCSGGNPRSGDPGLDDGGGRCRDPSLGHHFGAFVSLEVVLRWCGVSLPASNMVGLGGVVSWSLGGGRVR
jgi:hypothetical protein